MKSRVWNRKRVNTVTVWMLLGALVCFAVSSEQSFWGSDLFASESADVTHEEGLSIRTPLLGLFYIFVLASFLGFQLITQVPPLLHPRLMSGTNAISGISLVGSLVAAGADYGLAATLLGFVAVTCSMCNVVGGFLITDRMLRMFKKTDK